MKTLGDLQAGWESNFSFAAEETGEYEIQSDPALNTLQLAWTTHGISQFAPGPDAAETGRVNAAKHEPVNADDRGLTSERRPLTSAFADGA